MTPVASVTVWMCSNIGVVLPIGVLWEKGKFQCNIVLFGFFGCLPADGFGVRARVDGLALQRPYPWLGSALSMTRPCPSPSCLQSAWASIFAGIENDAVQAVSPVPVSTKPFVPVDHVVSLTRKVTLGVRLEVLGGPKVCLHTPHELGVSQCKACKEGKEEGQGKEKGKKKNASFCIFVQTLCWKCCAVEYECAFCCHGYCDTVGVMATKCIFLAAALDRDRACDNVTYYENIKSVVRALEAGQAERKRRIMVLVGWHMRKDRGKRSPKILKACEVQDLKDSDFFKVFSFPLPN